MKTLIALSAFLAAVLVAAFLLRVAEPDWIRETPFARSQNAAEDSALLTESDVEEIARAWAADNIGGAAGDEIVNLIVKESSTGQPDMLREYLKERVESATDWSYGPIAMANENEYELTAAASTLVHEMMPPPTFRLVSDLNVPTPDPADFRRVATAPFSLTVDADTMSVTDWRLRDDEAGVVSGFGSETNMTPVGDMYSIVRNLYEEPAANCITEVIGKGALEQDAATLFLPPQEREGADAARLRAAVNAAGLGGVCEEWIGGVCEEWIGE